MGDKTKFSAKEAADAFSYMAMAGWKTEDMLSGIEGIMNLAAASGEDLATTSDIVTDALTAFGMEAADAGHFSDILAVAASNANTDVGKMGETFKYVGTVCGTMGYSAEDAAMAIGLMANAGVKSSMAGTSLNAIITRLSTDAGASTKSLGALGTLTEKLGVAFYNADGSARPLKDVLLESREVWKNLTTEEKQNYANKIAGMEAAKSWNAIMNASNEDIAELTDSIRESNGAAKEMAAIMEDNLGGQLTILRGQIETFGIKLAGNVQEPMKELVKDAQIMVTGLKNVFDEGGFTGLVNATGDVLAQIVERLAEAAPDLINAATGLVGSFCDSLKSSPSIGDAVSGLITALVTGLFSCAGDIWTAAIVLAGKMAAGLADGAPQMAQAAARCVGDIIECIIDWLPDFIEAGKRIIDGIIQGVSEEFPSLGAFLSGLFEGFTSTLEPILSSVISVIEGIFSALGEADPATMEALGKAIGTIAAAMVTLNTAKAAASNIKGVVSAISSMSKGVKTAIGIVPKLVEGFQLLSGGAGTFSEVLALEFPKLAGIISKIGSAFSTVKSVITSIGSTVGGVAAVIGGAIMAVTNFFDMLKNGFSWMKEILMVIGTAIAAVGAVILGAPALVAGVIADIVAAVATLVVVIKDHWTQIVEFFKNLGSSIADFFRAIPETIRNLVDTAVSFFAELPNQIAYWLGYAIGTVIKWGIDLYNWATTEIPRIIDEIVIFFSELPGKIWTWLVDTISKVIQWGVNLLATASTAAQNAVNKVTEWFQQLPGKIWVWLTNTITKVTQFAVNLAAKASSAAQGFVTNLVDGVKGLPDKFQEIGSNIVNGIWNGISAGWSWLVDKVKSLADSLYQGAKDALGIESPSKVFAREVGRWIPPGIGVGMEKSMPDLQKKVDAEMAGLAKRMQMAVAIETGGITVRTKANAEHSADKEYPKGGGDTYIDRHIEMENNYHVPVVTPSESQKADREAARKLLGGLQ